MFKIKSANFINIQSAKEVRLEFSEGLNIIRAERNANNVGKSLLIKCLRVLTKHPWIKPKKLKHILTEGQQEGYFWIELTNGSMAGFKLLKDHTTPYFFKKLTTDKEAIWCTECPEEFLKEMGFMLDNKTKFTLNIADRVTGRLADDVPTETLYKALALITNSIDLEELKEKTEQELIQAIESQKDYRSVKSVLDNYVDNSEPKDLEYAERNVNIVKDYLFFLDYLVPMQELFEKIINIDFGNCMKEINKRLEIIEKLEKIQYLINNIIPINNKEEIGNCNRVIDILIRYEQFLERICPVENKDLKVYIEQTEDMEKINNIIKLVEKHKELSNLIEKECKEMLKIEKVHKEELQIIQCPLKGGVYYFENGCVKCN